MCVRACVCCISINHTQHVQTVSREGEIEHSLYCLHSSHLGFDKEKSNLNMRTSKPPAARCSKPDSCGSEYGDCQNYPVCS